MLARLAVALVYGVIAYLVCLFIGVLGGATNIPLVTVVTGFIATWAVVISIIVAVLTFFGNTTPFWKRA